MKEVKTTLGRMAVYYLLLCINIIPSANVIPDRFPTRNVSAIYLLTLAVCLVLYYSHRVSPTGNLSAMMRALSWMALLMILLRGIKYSAFSEVGVLARHTWYLYYVPMLLLPLFFFSVSLLVSSKEYGHLPRRWYWALALTVVLIVLVLTNDLHQQVFLFQPGFLGWDSDYSHGWLYYAIFVWQYALCLASILILIVKCRISSSKKNAWLILIPFAVSVWMNTLFITGKMPRLNGANIMEFPESMAFTAAVVLECCMQLGLIPTNTEYGKLFRHFSIAAQITDQTGAPVYASDAALPLTAEQFAMENGERIGEHTVLRKMEVPGGFGFWQEDMTELDRLNAELAETKEELEREGELRRLQNEMKERQTKIEQRTLVYDAIARRTQRQSQLISQLARSARLSPSAPFKEDCRGRITLLGAYIKRYANLMLLSRESSAIEVGELALSVSEVLRYLNFRGIPGEFYGSAQGTVHAEAALAVFEAFETLLEANLSSLRGVFVNLSGREAVTLKLTLEGLAEHLTEEMAKRLADRGVECDAQREDHVAYLSFALPKGGGET